MNTDVAEMSKFTFITDELDLLKTWLKVKPNSTGAAKINLIVVKLIWNHKFAPWWSHFIHFWYKHFKMFCYKRPSIKDVRTKSRKIGLLVPLSALAQPGIPIVLGIPIV